MKKRITSLLLALIMLLQIALPQNIFAEEDNKSLPHDKNVKMGEINAKSYGAKMMLDLNRLAARERKQKTSKNGFQLFSGGPYFGDDNEPTDENKPKYHGNVKAKLTVKGLNDEQFQWNEIFGVDEEGNPKPAQLIFTQINDDTGVETGVERYLKITEAGTYAWTDGDGNPAELPLFNDKLEPFFYEVRIDEDVAEKVQLLTATLFGSEDASPTFEQPDAEGRIKFNLVLDLTLQQVTSTKFTSKWNTGLDKSNRPQIQADAKFSGMYMGQLKTKNLTIDLPKNDTDEVIVRDLEDTGDSNLVITERLYNKAQVEIKTDTQGLEFDTTNKTVTSGEHKFKYDFTYDVINGGKLTMTEVISVTFDANGGKFASIIDENADQKIVKEVDYDSTLTDKAENPTKQGKAFKGWATDAEGKTPATEEDFANLKAAKTFYAIWSDEDIQAEELVTSESYGSVNQRRQNYTNNFVPKFEDLKAKVKVKDANGDFVPLPDTGVKFTIVDDKGNEYDKDSVDLEIFIYNKVKEKYTDEVSRTETVKAKITYDNGTTREIDINIKVLKNIYRGSDQGGKLPHIPEDYVKVTIDPTDKAQDPQKTYYYVNPAAKVKVPVGNNPVGKDDNKFSKWTMKADIATVDGSDYETDKRHQFEEASTITAQYGTGKIKISYVDQNGKEIDAKYHIAGQDYPSEKSGGLGINANTLDYAKDGPDFKGYIFERRDEIKGQKYADPATDTIKYHYIKRVTTTEQTNKFAYFKVVFDANGGKFGTETQKYLWVYRNPGEKPVTFEEARAELEGEYGLPTKDMAEFKEWQDKKADGAKVVDEYVVKAPEWVNGSYTPEVFYAHYEEASAFVKYIDLDGKPIADDFKIDGVEYPTEKTGEPNKTIASDVFTAETAPKLIGYKFNRIEINPVNSKYTIDNKATIKIYYEKLPDVIPEKDGSGNKNDKPEGYVEVKFVPTDKATDTTEKIFYVNPKKDVTIPIANPEAKATYTFKEWKMGANADGAAYTPSTAQKFTEKETVITATYEEGKNIIPYDPSATDPMPRPEGYVRVTFKAEKGLDLTEQKAYYVKKNAKDTDGNPITLGNSELIKPAYKEETGYKFKEWDQADTVEIKETDILVTAKPTKLDPVIPEKDDKGNTNERPEDYKVVTFVIKDDDKTKGSIDGVAKFYVNPTEHVKINPPTTKSNTGFEFGTWDKDATIPTVYDKDTTITGSFNGLKDVIPNKNPDGTDNKKPEGYKTVTFVIDPVTGGKIAENEVTVYYVNPEKEVTVPQPKTAADTGYEFEKWDQDTTTAKKYDQDTTVKGNFKKLDDIIPSTNDKGKPNDKPEGYVTLTFDKGTNGKSIEGQTVYYVNPNANISLGNVKIVKPTVTPKTGWEQKAAPDAWDKKDSQAISEDLTVTAQYEELKDIIPQEKTDGSDKPAGYITVTFEKGANGELEGKTVFYINPNKAVVLEDKAPTIKPNPGYTSAGWDISINKAIKYKDGDKITAKYNELGNVIPGDQEKPAGYVEVVFKKGEHGELSGTQTYWVKPEVEVTVPEPSVDPATGYKFKEWDKSTTLKAKATDTKIEINATYDSLENIIPGDQTKPKGYKTVTFKPDANGSLSGTTVYYVNPNVEVNLNDQAEAITKKANIGYTDKGGTWSPKIESKKYDEDAVYEFNFVKLDDVIPAAPGIDKPEGYVTVEFITDGHGSLSGITKYYVNPEKNITVGSTNLPIPGTNPNTNYVFDGWYEAIDKTEPIKNDKKFVARFKLNKVTMTYKADDKTSGSVPEALSYDIGTEIIIAGGNDLKKDNSVLIGWKIGDRTYKPGEKFTINADTTASAVWEAGLHTVNFDTVGGTHIDSQQVKHEELITPVGNPEKDEYFFVGWKIKGTDKVFDPTKDKVTEDITLVAQYSKDIIPAKDDGSKPEEVPDSFVLVEFKEGSNGTLTGTTKYWVNPRAGKKLSDIAHPNVTANEGWKQTGWDKTEDTEIKSALTVTAQYLKKILTEKPTENAEKYVKVEFKQGEHGTIADAETSTYWVLKDEAVTLTPPRVSSKTGYAQKTGDGAWSPKVETSYSRDTEHIAQYDYNGDDVIPQPGPDKPDNVPDNFVLVEFKPGDHGSIASTETVKYWVNHTKIVTLIPPRVTPKAGYEQEKGLGAWDKYLRDMFTQDTVITAQYRKLEEPYPVPIPDNPDNPYYPESPYYPERPYIPMYPEVRYETVIQEKVVEVPVPEKPYMKEVRYMQGFKGDFRLKDGLTRAEAAQILANALVEDGYKYNPNFKLSYKDIGEAWYTRAVKIVTEAKVFAGYDDGNFKPEDKITRNEWIATLKRFQEISDASGNHMNLKDGHWAMSEIEAAYNEGWLKIYSDGLATYKGDEFIPREEVAAVSNKAFKRVLDKTYIRNNEKSLISYKDVNKDMWSYEDILCASNTFLYKKDLYRAHWIKEDNNKFNVNTDGFEIVKAKFQRNPR